MINGIGSNIYNPPDKKDEFDQTTRDHDFITNAPFDKAMSLLHSCNFLTGVRNYKKTYNNEPVMVCSAETEDAGTKIDITCSFKFPCTAGYFDIVERAQYVDEKKDHYVLTGMGNKANPQLIKFVTSLEQTLTTCPSLILFYTRLLATGRQMREKTLEKLKTFVKKIL